MRHTLDAHRGQAVMTTVVFVFFTSVALVGIFSSVALTESQSARRTLSAEQTYYLAESGIEDVSYRILSGKHYDSSETLGLNNATTTTTTTALGNVLTVQSRGNVSGGVRAVEVSLQAGASGTFVYGVQVGRGGIKMENTSRIVGSIYSNGDIKGENSPVITGDAFAATNKKIDTMTVQGNARAYLITDSTIGKNASSTTDISDSTVGWHAYADRILSSTIGYNAYYQTSLSGSTVGGLTYPGTPAPAELPEIDLPISDATLDSWEADAASGGTISSPCPYKPADGTVLGPKKINCDMEIDGTKIITLTGTLWVSGNLKLQNSAQIKLDPSFGSGSGIIVVDNPVNRLTSSKITVQNSAQILGSGTEGSYVIVVSRNNSAENGGGEKAIDIKNTSNAPLYYAPHGSIEIQNSAALKEATAYKLEIKNNATVTYESGLLNVQFTTGPTGGYAIERWKETD